MTFVFIKHFLITDLITEEILIELLTNVTCKKKISMNSYIFFGFESFNDFNVTNVYQKNLWNIFY